MREDGLGDTWVTLCCKYTFSTVTISGVHSKVRQRSATYEFAVMKVSVRRVTKLNGKKSEQPRTYTLTYMISRTGNVPPREVILEGVLYHDVTRSYS